MNELAKLGEYMMAVYVIISFAAYLRPSECLRLRSKDLVKPMKGNSQNLIINLRPNEEGQQSKVAVSDEAIVWDSAGLEWMVQVFTRVRSQIPGHAEIFTCSYPILRHTLEGAFERRERACRA